MTPRQAKLKAVADDMRSGSPDPANLKVAQGIVEAMLLDPDGFAALIELRQRKKWAFDAVVTLATDELKRRDGEPSELEPVRNPVSAAA